MKKKLFIFPFLLVFLLLVASCGKKKSDLQVVVESISSSEQLLTQYQEQDIIKDGDFVLYTKNITFEVERKEEVKTRFDQTEETLNTNTTDPSSSMVTTKTSYTTIGTKKYQIVNGSEQETGFVVPTYFLTFKLSSDYLEEGYKLEKNKKKYALTAKIKEDKIKEFFLDKNLSDINELSITINIENSKLANFEANYINKAGFLVSIAITYSYDAVSISR